MEAAFVDKLRDVVGKAHAWIAVDEPAQTLELSAGLREVFDTAIQAFEMLSASEVQIGLAGITGTRLPFDTNPPWSVMVELGAADPQSRLTKRLEEVLGGLLQRGVIQADWNAVADKRGTVLAVQKVLHDLAIDMGGRFSAEHGVGRKLVSELERLSPPAKLQLMRSIKLALDPQRLLNPGALHREGFSA